MSDLDPLAAPEITLRGKRYKLPELELAQAIPITRRLLKLRGRMLSELDEAGLEDLHDIGFLTLSSLEPELTKEAYDARPAAYHELVKAFSTIMVQSGFVSQESLNEAAALAKQQLAKEQAAGEAKAESGTGKLTS